MERLPPYIVEVKQENIAKFLYIMKNNNLLKDVKITTVLGDEVGEDEIDDIIENMDENEKEGNQCKWCVNEQNRKSRKM